MAIKTQSPRAYDDAKLAAMVEPLTIRIEKIKGTSRTPVPLPEGEDGKQGGTEWAKEDVRGMENWLVTEWTGGGLYEITVTDSSPTPNVMKWSPYWNPADYPEKLPPPLAAAARQQPTTSAPNTPNPQVRMPAFPNGFPSFPQATATAPQAPQWYPQPQQFFMPQPPLPPAPTPGSPQWAAWQDAAEKRRLDEELRLMREQAAQREREALNAKHDAQLAAERQASEQRTRALEQQISELRNLMTAQNASTQKNPELEALRMQLDAQRQQMELQARAAEATRIAAEQKAAEERREREAERREREMKDLIKSQQETAQRQIEEMRRQMESQQREAAQAALLAAQAANKQDPMIPMFLQMMQSQTEAAKEAARQNADAIKEVARNQAASMAQLQSTMMTPIQAMQLVKDSASQADGATAKVQQLFGTVIDMQQKVMENALQMQPSGSPVPGLIEKGIDTVQATIERYVGAKSTEERVKAQAQAQIVEAQSRAYVAAQQAQAGVHTPPPPVEQAQLAGVNNVVPITEGKKKSKKRAAAAEQPTPGAVSEPVVTGDNTKRLGRTDIQWFGLLLAEVEQLRMGIDRFMESMQMEPPRLDAHGNLDGISPEIAWMGINQAVAEVMRRQVVIPAMVDLLFQKRFADFVDVLVPNAPQQYRDDLVTLLARGAVEDDDEGDEGDEDDEGEGDDGEPDATTPPPAPQTPNGRPQVTH